MTRERVVRAWFGTAVIAFGFFLLLGMEVSRRGEPPLLLGWEHGWFDHSTLVAWRLTESCYPRVLIPIGIVLLILAVALRNWRVRILTSIASLLIAWRGADFFQHYFARPRPVEWAIKHELSFSYPSSHAAIAVGFYGLWAALFYFSDLPKPVRTIGGLLLAIFAAGVCWSRLALGAHYLTDIAGGALLGLVAAALCAAFVTAVFGRVAGPAERGQNRAA
ncbi:MAG TPA: phosphatase PAP2 family protein [Candidatus Cybelea sp.]|nr:phosphatase PAP2 family protein [Candidatus Cybelea sp.]